MPRTKELLKAAVAYVEQKTLQAHFRSVELELLSQPPTQARLKVLELLRDYRVRGRFPRNSSRPGARAPFLRDHLGTACAMAYLMEETGKKDLADRLAAADNNLYMEDARDPELLEWLAASGLSQAEAARIQPGYNFHQQHGVIVKKLEAAKESPILLQIPAPTAQDETLLVLLGALLAGAAVWFAVRWFRQSRLRIKEPRPAPSYIKEEPRASELSFS